MIFHSRGSKLRTISTPGLFIFVFLSCINVKLVRSANILVMRCKELLPVKPIPINLDVVQIRCMEDAGVIDGCKSKTSCWSKRSKKFF